MRIAIVGGAGKMGRWVARAITRKGQQVVIIDRDHGRLASAAMEGFEVSPDFGSVASVDALIIAVPIAAFEKAVKSLAPFARPGQIVLDITSIKLLPVELMHRYLPDCTVLGTHPVFGPGTEDLCGQNIVLTPESETENTLASSLRHLLQAEGAVVTIMSPRKHDELMSAVLGLSHYLAIVAGDTLLSIDNISQMTSVSGPTFRALLSLVESVLREDPGLYASIQINLPALPEVERLCAEKARQWADITASGAEQEFMERMRNLRRMFEKRYRNTV
jgi:prephenate dehydrogenase